MQDGLADEAGLQALNAALLAVAALLHSAERHVVRGAVAYELAGRPAGELSGGQQQMLAIGRSHMRQPDVLLLDEPSLGLAPLLVQQILSVARERAERAVAVLLAEQNAAAALRVAGTGALMENGVLIRVDDAAALLADDDVSRRYLGPVANPTSPPIPSVHCGRPQGTHL